MEAKEVALRNEQKAMMDATKAKQEELKAVLKSQPADTGKVDSLRMSIKAARKMEAALEQQIQWAKRASEDARRYAT